MLSSDDINSCEDLIKNSKILVTNLEIPAQTVLTSLKLARKHNGKNRNIQKYLVFVSNKIEWNDLKQTEPLLI